MKVIEIIVLLAVCLLEIVVGELKNANLTMWRHHRREKRFLIYQNLGICKLSCGVTLPVDLHDKKPWRQLVTLYNVQFQFPEPTKPIYWWNKWGGRDIALGESETQSALAYKDKNYKDDAQIFVYEFIVEYLNQHGTNGRQCLQLAICENAQLHLSNGLFAELLHRILLPHRTLPQYYMDAYKMGKHGINCPEHFPHAQNCLLDQFVHVREVSPEQTFVKT